MNKKWLYLLFGGILLFIRFYLNHHSEMIPGLNGGYYPVQIRSILENGQLGFPDMPLYFYLNAFFIKMASFFTTTPINELIIPINKIVDSISASFIVLPLFYFRKNILTRPLPIYFEIALLAFVTLSFPIISLTSELQKNAAALPLMLFFMYYLMVYYKRPSPKTLLLTIVFFILTGLTHFGVFSVALAFLILSLFVFYRKKALFPAIGLGILGIGLVFLFDSTRAIRLMQSALVVFDRPALFGGRLSPPLMLNILLGYPLMIYTFFLLRKGLFKETTFVKNILFSALSLLFILTFPMMNDQYAMRLTIMAFAPLFLVFIILSYYLNSFFKISATIVLLIITGLSLFTMVGHPSTPAVNQEGFEDLRRIHSDIEFSDNTLLVAKHGLEWWIAWELTTKVGQAQAISETTFSKYDKIISVVQLAAAENHNRQPMPFPNPYAPKDKTPIYQSNYFKLVELTLEDLDELKKSSRMHGKPPRGRKPRR